MRLTPLEDNVIIKIIQPDNKIGESKLIVAAPDSVKESTLAEVLIPNSISYFRDGKLREAKLKSGMKVRVAEGNKGRKVPEAPDGEVWYCIPEDMIYYIVEE